MNLNIFQFFQPKDKIFFLLFQKAAANATATAKVLVELVNTSNPEKRRDLFREIERLEHVGDAITHETYNQLSLNFITPFDRDDIHSLVSAVDDIVDYIHGATKRMELYKVENMTPAIIKLAELILKGAEELEIAIIELRNLKNITKIKEATVRINSIENHADDIFDMAIAKLFEEEKNAVEVIKMKDVLSMLETATDKCEDAADVINSILIKNA
ncbi:MAG: phosphate transport regulator [Bacteroidetes bacterium RIFCSPLOWO2_12_FULL_35_15]|nr:MAG: phosphate transport regulator [Bacteroidetes bacterium RIFCSPLOWO2_12_FULL_35_15]